VALRLARDDDRVEARAAPRSSASFLPAELLAVRARRSPRAEHRVVLGQRSVALDLEGRLRLAAMPWKKNASSTAETSAWPMPPSSAW
jgi:hypothetical protein